MSVNEVLIFIVGFSQGYLGYVYIVGMTVPLDEYFRRSNCGDSPVFLVIAKISYFVIALSAHLGIGWVWINILSSKETLGRGYLFKCWFGSSLAGLLVYAILPALEKTIRKNK